MKTTLDPIKEAIKLLAFNPSEQQLDTMISNIMKTDYGSSFSQEKELQMIENLNIRIGQTLGALLQNALEKEALSLETLSEEISFPSNIFKDLLVDSMAITNIPVMLFKKLIDRLNLSINDIENSVRNSASVLKINTSSPAMAYSMSYNRKADNTLLNLDNSKQAVLELFENDEAIELYLKRLSELTNK